MARQLHDTSRGSSRWQRVKQMLWASSNIWLRSVLFVGDNKQMPVNPPPALLPWQDVLGSLRRTNNTTRYCRWEGLSQRDGCSSICIGKKKISNWIHEVLTKATGLRKDVRSPYSIVVTLSQVVPSSPRLEPRTGSSFLKGTLLPALVLSIPFDVLQPLGSL